MEASQWATVATAIATFLAVLVALFKEEIARFWRRPRLTASIRLAAPHCHKTHVGSVLRYYFRIWVQNEGRQRAERVQVYAAKLFIRTQAAGTFRQMDNFLPMNLRWAPHPLDSDSPARIYDDISPFMGKHVDLGYIADPTGRTALGDDLPDVEPHQTIFHLDLEVLPMTLSHLLPPGVYRLELKLAAANAYPVKKQLEINHTGNWFPDEPKMFTDGIGIRRLD